MRRVIVIVGLLLLGLAFAKSFGAMDRDHHDREAWKWLGATPADGWLHVRNSNGPIRVEESEGDSIAIIASKSWTGHRPQEVAFVTNRVGSDVYVCALYGGGGESDCDEDSYRNRPAGWLKRRILRIRPVSVAFTIHAPSTARINADTRNGGIAVDAPLAAMVANTRNGSIKLEKPVGAIEAHTRNGSISAIVRDGPLAGDVLLETRNGSVTVELPEDVDANVSLVTRNGRVSSAFRDVQPTKSSAGNASRTNVSGILGNGGPKVSLESRHGSVRLNSRPVVAKSDSASVTVSGRNEQ